MHAKFLGGLALISFVMGKYLKDVAPFELPKCVRVRDAGTMHLRDQAIQFALQLCPHLAALAGCRATFELLLRLPRKRIMLEEVRRLLKQMPSPGCDLLLKMPWHHEG